MNRKAFTPVPGTAYQNQGGGVFICLGDPDPDQGGAVPMMNKASGWTFYAHEVGIYEDDSIDWNYSTGGFFQNNALQKAVATYGKEKQIDMMIEEMAELMKALLNERRGRDNNISEEMADVRIMLQQMEIIFQNEEQVNRIAAVKINRLHDRLHGLQQDA